MKKQRIDDQIVIYQTKNGAIQLKQDTHDDTVWASQSHIADIFEAERSLITKHIRNILKDKELDANSVCAKMAHTASELTKVWKALLATLCNLLMAKNFTRVLKKKLHIYFISL